MFSQIFTLVSAAMLVAGRMHGMRGLPVVGGVVDGIVGGAGGIVGGAGNGGSPVDGAGGETATVTVTEKYCPPTGTVTVTETVTGTNTASWGLPTWTWGGGSQSDSNTLPTDTYTWGESSATDTWSQSNSATDTWSQSQSQSDTATATWSSEGPKPTEPSNGQCNTGKIQCCDKVTKVKDTGSDILSGLLNIGLVLDDLVGIQCSPIDVIAVGSGSSCTGQVACCKDDTFNGVVNIACSPVNVSL